MSPDPESQKAPLAVDELARVVLELAAQPDLGTLLARFTDLVRGWAAPSAQVAAVRRPDRGGWRLLPALSFGSVPLGVEHALQQLVEDLPDCLVRPTLQQPAESVPGVNVRDNWIVPWWSEGESGLLFLRGVPRPYPSNLGDALALVSAPVWPRLLGGPATRMQSLVEQLQQVSGALQAEAGRELERLQVAASAAVDPAILARLEAELRAAKDEAARRSEEAVGHAEEAARLRDEHAALTERLRALEEQRGISRAAEARARASEDALAAAQQAIASHAGALRSERAAAVERIEAHRLALEEADHRALENEQALAVARKELAAQAELLEAERAAVERVEQQRRAADAAEARARAAGEALGAQLAETLHELAVAREGSTAARKELVAVQQALVAARGELAVARGQTAAAEAQARSGGEALGPVHAALVTLRRSAFVPAGLRLALEDVSAALEPEAPRQVPRSRIVILDRDLGGPESLAAELEAAGLDVRVANYPEELALLLRTPASKDIAAAICDVMAFRPDQNVAGLLRSWEKDRPGLAFFLSYDAESSVELERSRRVPPSLTAGHLLRPLPAARVIEAMDALARRQVRP